MTYASQARPLRGTLFQKLAEFRAELADRFARYQLYRQTVQELAGLNDRELGDLGLTRGDIHRIAVEAAYGK